MEYMFCFTTVYIHILHLFINLRSESGGKKIQEKYKKIKKESFNEKGEKKTLLYPCLFNILSNKKNGNK